MLRPPLRLLPRRSAGRQASGSIVCESSPPATSRRRYHTASRIQQAQCRHRHTIRDRLACTSPWGTAAHRLGSLESIQLLGQRQIRTSASTRSAAPDRPTDDEAVAGKIRALMRSSAQPVAIVTTYLSPPSPPSSHSSGALLVHGATLSSFTTISLDPPLVAFSLKMPSRLASALVPDAARAAHPEHQQSTRHTHPHFIINVLSCTQDAVAASFAQPGMPSFDLAELPSLAEPQTQPSSGSNDEEDVHPLAREDLLLSQHAFALPTSSKTADAATPGLSVGGQASAVPILSASLGALACSIQASLDLGSLDSGPGTGLAGGREEKQAGSRLFIARVHAVENLRGIDEDQAGEKGLPLLYWRQKFTTVAQEGRQREDGHR